MNKKLVFLSSSVLALSLALSGCSYLEGLDLESFFKQETSATETEPQVSESETVLTETEPSETEPSETETTITSKETEVTTTAAQLTEATSESSLEPSETETSSMVSSLEELSDGEYFAECVSFEKTSDGSYLATLDIYQYIVCTDDFISNLKPGDALSVNGEEVTYNPDSIDMSSNRIQIDDTYCFCRNEENNWLIIDMIGFAVSEQIGTVTCEITDQVNILDNICWFSPNVNFEDSEVITAQFFFEEGYNVPSMSITVSGGEITRIIANPAMHEPWHD